MSATDPYIVCGWQPALGTDCWGLLAIAPKKKSRFPERKRLECKGILTRGPVVLCSLQLCHSFCQMPECLIELQVLVYRLHWPGGHASWPAITPGG